MRSMIQQLDLHCPREWPRSKSSVLNSLPLAFIAVTWALAPSFPSRWVFMWALAGSIYANCKWLTLIHSKTHSSLGRMIGYLFAWPGLNANKFLRIEVRNRCEPGGAPKVGLHDWALSFGQLTAGLLILFVLLRFLPAAPSGVVPWCGMIGIILTLHFGLFSILSCLWRTGGVDAPPLMNAPLRSTSLVEFWGRRWNRGFRDFSHEFLFRPFAKSGHPHRGLFLVFLFSGVVHDAVISVPAGAGFGLPTLYFLIQWLGILLERSPLGKNVGLGQGATGWIFTASVLLLPASLLFHEPFRMNVIVPMLTDWGVWPC